MEVLLAVLLILLCLLLGFLLLPVRLRVDTDQTAFCHLDAGGIFQIRAGASPEGLLLEWQFLAWHKRWDLNMSRQTTQSNREKTRSRRRPGTFPSPLRLLRAFRLDYLEWRLDTGDFVCNGQLYPLCYEASRARVRLSVNYQGDNRLCLQVSTRPYRLLAALLAAKRQ
jgi:hypothetical protein